MRLHLFFLSVLEVMGGYEVLLEVNVWVYGAYFNFRVCSQMEDEVIAFMT